ncbi:MAG TPA: hypothetical protein VEY30_04905 [Myxococcaceae bacterium]|nr:hypothetical protein [Myxococcaceae bacterium]
MAKINGGPPRNPVPPPNTGVLSKLDPRQLWPWGGPRFVRERLVDPGQLERKKAKKKGDPKSPALASAALLDFIGPAHSADEQRLTMPEMPAGHDAELSAFSDRPYLETVSQKASEDHRQALERSLDLVRTAPERAERLRVLLSREHQMLQVIARVNEDVRDIYRKMREEQQDRGY